MFVARDRKTGLGYSHRNYMRTSGDDRCGDFLKRKEIGRPESDLPAESAGDL